VVEATEVIIDKFLKHGVESDYDVFDDFGLLTLDVVCRAAFGWVDVVQCLVAADLTRDCTCSYEGNPQLNPEDRYSQSIGEVSVLKHV
jgi:hypothetical protein